MDNNNQAYNTFYTDNSSLPNHNQSSNFDILFWIFKILKYWYLFLIAIIIALGLAYFKNLTWTPTLKTMSTILIEENKKQGLGDLAPSYSSQNQRNINNQMIMYSSYDLISKSVDKLGVGSEIYQKQHFQGINIKDINLYKISPIKINGTYVANNAYGLEFQIKGVNETKYQVSYNGDERISAFTVEGEYGKSLQHSLFFIIVEKTDYFQNVTPYNLYFRFISRDQQIADYSSRLRCRFLLEGASVMEISLTGKVAERDIDFMGILNKEFFDDNLARKNLSAEKAIEFIEDQILIIKDSINSSESKLNQYQLSAGIYSQDQSARVGSELGDLDEKKAQIKLKKEYTKFLTDVLAKDNETLVAPSATGVQDPSLSALVENYNTLSSNMKSLGKESPIYKRYKSQLDDTKKTLNDAISAINNSTRIEENIMNQRYNKVLSDRASMPERERKLLTHERDFKINESYNTYLLQKRIESQIQKASNAPDNLVLDQPRTVAVVNGQDRINTYMLFALVGLLIPLIFVICKEILFKFTIQSREEVERIAGLPIVGTIERSNKKEQIVVKSHPKSSFTEGFRSLRSRMEYIAKKEKPIIMLVTSTEPKDGKTFIACNLAEVYQITGKKTIIIDFDLRRPALSKFMGMDQDKGISNYLIGQVTLPEIINTHPEYDFDVLPAGTVPPNPSELLRSHKTKELLNELGKIYDYIVLDCSPVGLVSDAHFLSKLVDVVLYVVRNEKTNRNFFKYTINELKEEQANNVAIVYNDVNLKGGYYGSRRYYGRSSYYLKHNSYYHNNEKEEKDSTES